MSRSGHNHEGPVECEPLPCPVRVRRSGTMTDDPTGAGDPCWQRIILRQSFRSHNPDGSRESQLSRHNPYGSESPSMVREKIDHKH